MFGSDSLRWQLSNIMLVEKLKTHCTWLYLFLNVITCIYIFFFFSESLSFVANCNHMLRWHSLLIAKWLLRSFCGFKAVHTLVQLSAEVIVCNYLAFSGMWITLTFTQAAHASLQPVQMAASNCGTSAWTKSCSTMQVLLYVCGCLCASFLSSCACSHCQQPFHIESTSSRPITEVKQRWTQLVWTKSCSTMQVLLCVFVCFLSFFLCLFSSPTAIPRWKHWFLSDHKVEQRWTQLVLKWVTTWEQRWVLLAFKKEIVCRWPFVVDRTFDLSL